MLSNLLRTLTRSRLHPRNIRHVATAVQATPTIPSAETLAAITMHPVHAEYDAQREEQYVILPNNHGISFAEYGDKHGKPLFFFHGSIGCRYDGAEIHKVAKELGLRVISPDRPGHGLSTMYDNRTLLDYPNDIDQLATHLGISKYHCLGISGGGPFAIACAYALNKDRLIKSTFLAGMAPWSFGMQGVNNSVRFSTYALAYLPTSLIRYVYKSQFPLERLKDDAFMLDVCEKVVKGFEQGDMKDMTAEEREEIKIPLINAMRQGYRQGPDGALSDVGIYTSDWGFELEDVEGEVLVCMAKDDTHTPAWHGKLMVDKMKNARYVEYKDVTHMTIGRNWESMLNLLMNDTKVDNVV